MMCELPAADLNELQQAVATSPIVAPVPSMVHVPSLEERLADWQNTRHAPDVDQVILAWLASHRGVRRAMLS